MQTGPILNFDIKYMYTPKTRCVQATRKGSTTWYCTYYKIELKITDKLDSILSSKSSAVSQVVTARNTWQSQQSYLQYQLDFSLSMLSTRHYESTQAPPWP